MQDLNRVWKAILGELELSLSQGNFSTWFKNSYLLEATSSGTVIGVPNVFIKNQIEKKYTPLLEELFEKNNIASEQIIIKIYDPRSPSKKEDTVLFANEALKQSSQKGKTQQKRSTPITHKYRRGLNSAYTFENFIVGSGNDFAHAACQAISTNPGKKYNPLFIYGGVGIGKTHLIQAVGNQIVKQNPRAHVVYVSSEQFVQEFLDAIRFKKNTDFADYYRSADVLIIDDIQFIANKEKTQEEFFHTFNALHQANKQIIISGDRPPQEIPTLEERLQSRFAWGMTIDMQVPDFETRCAIVQQKAEGSGMHLPHDVVEYLANLITTNIRELEGALNQLLAFCEMRNIDPDVQAAKTLLGSAKARPKHLSPKKIIDHTAEYYSVTVDELLSPKRDKEIVYPRQIAMYILRSELHMSFPKIANELGRKDHTTAIHSVEKIQNQVNNDPAVRQQLSEIREQLYV